MTVITQPLEGTFTTDPIHSSFQFEIAHMEVGTFRAGFDEVQATVVADEGGVRLEGSLRVASVSIRQPEEFREHVVNGPDFFDGATHPEITFRCDDVSLADDGSLTGQGEMTIRGVTRPVAAAGHYQRVVEDPFGSLRTAIELTAVVDRRDWGMDWQMPMPDGGDMLGYEVRLSAQMELVQQN